MWLLGASSDFWVAVYWPKSKKSSSTAIFSHLTDALIWSDLIQAINTVRFLSVENWTHNLWAANAMLYKLKTQKHCYWTTGIPSTSIHVSKCATGSLFNARLSSTRRKLNVWLLVKLTANSEQELWWKHNRKTNCISTEEEINFTQLHFLIKSFQQCDKCQHCLQVTKSKEIWIRMTLSRGPETDWQTHTHTV